MMMFYNLLTVRRTDRVTASILCPNVFNSESHLGDMVHHTSRVTLPF